MPAEPWSAWLPRHVALSLPENGAPNLRLGTAAGGDAPARDLLLARDLAVRPLLGGPTAYCCELVSAVTSEGCVRLCFESQSLFNSWVETVCTRGRHPVLPAVTLPPAETK